MPELSAYPPMLRLPRRRSTTVRQLQARFLRFAQSDLCLAQLAKQQWRRERPDEALPGIFALSERVAKRKAPAQTGQ